MKYVRMILVMTVLTGVLYPLLIWIIALPMQNQMSLIGQEFQNEKYFWSRPSAVNYNPMPSGGSNLSPMSKELQELVKKRRKKYGGGEVPVDLLYASGSGLDPHISKEAAFFQMDRVAKARNVDRKKIEALIEAHLEQGILGPACVNVLLLNKALDE